MHANDVNKVFIYRIYNGVLVVFYTVTVLAGNFSSVLIYIL